LHLSVAPQGWRVIEFDRSGVERRHLFLPEVTSERPLLTTPGPDSVEFSWPRRGSEGPQKKMVQWMNP
jgi:hypothetical protein